MITEKPWGTEELLKRDDYTWVKLLTINPDQRISYQTHALRNEVWTIVAGKAIITLEGEEYIAKVHDTVVIPKGVPHRIHNFSKKDILIVCEVATGLPDDKDIVRLSDDYGR